MGLKWQLQIPLSSFSHWEQEEKRKEDLGQVSPLFLSGKGEKHNLSQNHQTEFNLHVTGHVSRGQLWLQRTMKNI